MKLTAIELRRISLPLVAPFRTSFGTETTKDALLVRAVTPDAEGWGECVAMDAPLTGCVPGASATSADVFLDDVRRANRGALGVAARLAQGAPRAVRAK